MLKKEVITVEGIEFTRHYSDSGVLIRKVGTEEVYEEALDDIPCPYTYEETVTEIPSEKQEMFEEAQWHEHS